jgi:Trk-type K+ transport system membrane component
VSRSDKRKQKDVKTAALPLGDRARADSDGREADGESPAWRFIGAYLTLILIGFMVFRHPATMVGGNELSVDRAMFTSVNAVTLTGFQQTLAIDEYRWPGKIAALLLTIGGTVVTLIAGGKAVARIAKTRCHDRGIIVGAVVLEILAIFLGAILMPGRGRSIFESIFQAVSALGHSGLVIGAVPSATDWRTHIVLLPLALLGGLGLPVLLCIGAAIRRRGGLHPYARFVLVAWAASYVIGLIALALLSGGSNWQERLGAASAQAINSRTVGLPLPIGDVRPVHWILIVLMTVGGVSGGAAGGIKMTTLTRIWTGARAALRGEAPGRVFAMALLWLGGYGLLVFAALLALLATNPDQPGDRLLFLVVSAASNVGLAHNPVAIVGPGMFVLCGAMFLGRVLPLAVLWWTVHVARDQAELPVG